MVVEVILSQQCYRHYKFHNLFTFEVQEYD